jgi:hypothetical protein
VSIWTSIRFRSPDLESEIFLTLLTLFTPANLVQMLPKISIQIFSQSLLAGTFALLSSGNAILTDSGSANASEIPTAAQDTISSTTTSVSDNTSNLNPVSISDPMVDERSIFGETRFDPATDLKMSYVSPLSDVLPRSVDRQTISQTPASSLTIQPSAPKKWAVGVHAQASTTGFIGVDGGYKFSPNLHARLGLNTVGFNYNYSSEGIDYSANFKPTNIHLLGDYFPFGGGLRLTGGFVIQNNKFTATAKSSSNNQITLNGNTYDASQVGTVGSEGKFGSSVAPYLGIGFGTPINSGFGFNVDAGVMFAGSPTVALSANNISSSIPTTIQNQIRSDLAAQEQKTNADIRSFNLYPVLSIGFSYAF